eukprot:2359824-Pleurochrysis_carterae.AAC.3
MVRLRCTSVLSRLWRWAARRALEDEDGLGLEPADDQARLVGRGGEARRVVVRRRRVGAARLVRVEHVVRAERAARVGREETVRLKPRMHALQRTISAGVHGGARRDAARRGLRGRSSRGKGQGDACPPPMDGCRCVLHRLGTRASA